MSVEVTDCHACVYTREQRDAAVSQVAELAARWWEKILIDNDMEPGEIEFHRAVIRRALDGAERRSRADKPSLLLVAATGTCCG